MDRAFITACAEFSSSYRNWNAEFQLAWEMEDNTLHQAISRQQEIYRIEGEFVAEAVRTVKQIVTLDDDGPRELPKFLQCYRVDNIFFRVLPDSRSGRNYVASLRGVLQSRTPLLTVPLSCMLFYRGMPVLAQALVPMPRRPTRLYGADSTNDKEVEAEILHMAEALNIAPPEHIICEVYQGLDTRFYCVLTNITTIPVSEKLAFGGPIKRQEMLVFCAIVTSGPEDVLTVLRAPPVLDALAQLREIASGDVQAQLCDTLHFYGVNFCFLKEVLRIFITHRGDIKEAVKALEVCIAVEMIARTVKQEFYLRVQSNRTAYDDATLQNDITRNISNFLDEDQFKNKFLPILMRKYNIYTDEKDIIKLCEKIRLSRRRDIISRISVLIGARLRTEGSSEGDKIVWLPKVQSRIVPLLLDPNMLTALASQYNVTRTIDSHRNSWCLPIQSKVAYWEGQFDQSLKYVRLIATAKKTQHGSLSIIYLYSIRNLCELLFSGSTIELISEGCDLLQILLDGFSKRTGSITRMRRHIESGCWLLGCSDIIDLKEEALQHFQAAARLSPNELRSNFGMWLYIQPFLGILRCKQALRTRRLVDITDIVRDAKELASVVTPADYFVEYLWELGMELRWDGQFETASKTLLMAIKMCRKVRSSELNIGALKEDIINVYRAWDPVKYGAYCEALLTGMIDTSSRNTSRPSNSSGIESYQ